MNIIYIGLKQVIWRFCICNYFREILKFRDFMSALMILRNFVRPIKLIVENRRALFSAKIVLLPSPPSPPLPKLRDMLKF